MANKAWLMEGQRDFSAVGPESKQPTKRANPSLTVAPFPDNNNNLKTLFLPLLNYTFFPTALTLRLNTHTVLPKAVVSFLYSRSRRSYILAGWHLFTPPKPQFIAGPSK
jgi:hypothetical protein